MIGAPDACQNSFSDSRSTLRNFETARSLHKELLLFNFIVTFHFAIWETIVIFQGYPKKDIALYGSSVGFPDNVVDVLTCTLSQD